MFKLNLLAIILIFSISFGFLITPVTVSFFSSEPSNPIVIENDLVISSPDLSNQISQLENKIVDDQNVIISLENSLKLKDDEVRSLNSQLVDIVDNMQESPSSNFQNNELNNMNEELLDLKDQLTAQNIIIENINAANLTVVSFDEKVIHNIDDNDEHQVHISIANFGIQQSSSFDIEIQWFEISEEVMQADTLIRSKKIRSDPIPGLSYFMFEETFFFDLIPEHTRTEVIITPLDE